VIPVFLLTLFPLCCIQTTFQFLTNTRTQGWTLHLSVAATLQQTSWLDNNRATYANGTSKDDYSDWHDKGSYILPCNNGKALGWYVTTAESESVNRIHQSQDNKRQNSDLTVVLYIIKIKSERWDEYTVASTGGSTVQNYPNSGSGSGSGDLSLSWVSHVLKIGQCYSFVLNRRGGAKECIESNHAAQLHSLVLSLFESENSQVYCK